MRISSHAAALAAIAMIATAGAASGQTIFDDFNENIGHFDFPPGMGASMNSGGSSEWSTDDPFEGAGIHRMNMVIPRPGEDHRERYYSGSGLPAYNIEFATDGYIGLYVRTTQANMSIAIALDGPTNQNNQLNMSTPLTIINDGQWHLYEWNLNDSTQWGAATNVTGSGRGLGPIATVDSLYFFNTNPTKNYVVDLDLVAHNPHGSIAALVPEPASIAAFAGLGLLSLRRRRA